MMRIAASVLLLTPASLSSAGDVTRRRRVEMKPISGVLGGEDGQEEGGPLGMANPASVNCAKVGGIVQITKTKDGDEYGLCAKPGGETACEEWALLREECDLETNPSFAAWCTMYEGRLTKAIPPTCSIDGEEPCAQYEYYTTHCGKEDADDYDPYMGIEGGSMSMPTPAMSMSMPASTEKDVAVMPLDPIGEDKEEASLKDKVTDKVDEVKDKVEEVENEVKDKAEEVVDEVKDKLEEIIGDEDPDSSSGARKAAALGIVLICALAGLP